MYTPANQRLKHENHSLEDIDSYKILKVINNVLVKEAGKGYQPKDIKNQFEKVVESSVPAHLVAFLPTNFLPFYNHGE